MHQFRLSDVHSICIGFLVIVPAHYQYKSAVSIAVEDTRKNDNIIYNLSF